MSDVRNELEALDDGLTSEFWRLFGDHVTREWGPAGLRYQQAVRDAAKSAEAVVELQKVLYAQEQLIALMQWPRDRQTALRQQRQQQLAPVNMSRRGQGL